MGLRHPLAPSPFGAPEFAVHCWLLQCVGEDGSRGAKMAGWPFLTRVFDLFCLVHSRRVQQLNHLSISKGGATNFRIHVPHNEF